MAFFSSAIAQDQSEQADDGLDWHDILEVGLENQGWTDTETPFDRLPARAKGVVPSAVWDLSLDTAGLCARFVTNASAIHARWTVRDGGLAMDHMPATGVSGVDLYVRDGDVWRWIGIGRPQSKPTIQKTLAEGIPEGTHEFMLYLPLYNGVTSIEVGLPKGSTFEKAPARPANRARPILVWGTSIAQGGCACRPGMVYSSILGRMLDSEVINLGFSGNGQMQPEVTPFFTEVDASIFVLDCCPNMGPELISERTEPTVNAFREAHPHTPIVLVENIKYQAGAFLPAKREAYESKNAALRAAYDRLIAAGVEDLYYIPCDDLLGDDGEATVDGTHATDIGFLRMAEAMAPTLRKILDGEVSAGG
jgi:lysophospholipase L1-like esterase